MIIEQLQIDSFGFLKQQTYTFSRGLNIIEGENETGKSTLCLFIKFMLYGLARGTEREQGVSFDTGRAAGTMTIRVGGERYRIERTLTASGNTFKEQVRTLDLRTGAPAFVNDEPGTALFGVNGDVFLNTAFIRQTADSTVGGKTLRESVENILFSAHEDINTKKAIKKLEDVRVYYLHKNRKGGLLWELEQQLNDLEGRLEHATVNDEQLTGVKASIAEVKRNLDRNREKIDRLQNLMQVNEELAALSKLDSVQQAREREEAEKQAAEDLIYRTFRTPEMPRTDYVTELKLGAEKLRHCQQDLDQAQEQYRDMEFRAVQENPKEDLMHALAEAGGLDAVRGEKKQLLRTRLICTICFTVFLLLALGLGGLLGMTYWISRSVDMLQGVLFAAALALSFFFLACRGAAGGKIEALIRRYRCDTLDEFDNFLEEYSISEARLNFHADNLAAGRARVAQAQELLDEQARQCAETLEHLRDPESPAIDPTHLKAEHLEDIAQQLQCTVQQIREHLAQAEQYRAVWNNILSQLSAYGSAEAVRERITQLQALQKQYNPDGLAPDRLKLEIDFARKANAALEERRSLLYEQLAALQSQATDPKKTQERLLTVKEQYADSKRKYRAVCMALDAVFRASEQLRSTVAPRLCEQTVKTVDDVIGGEKRELYLDENYTLNYSDGGKAHPASLLSAGTRDLTYFALRLSLVDMLYTEQLPPLILDESFVKMDDGRMHRALTVLAHRVEKEGQALLFTCHTREREAAAQIGSYSLVEL